MAEKTQNSTNKVLMIQKKITTPQIMDIKILTEFQANIPTLYRPSHDFQLAQMFVYTQKYGFSGKIKGQNINEQLSWSPQSLNTLIQCLTGKRQKVQIKFQLKEDKKLCQTEQNTLTNQKMSKVLNYTLELICQIKSGINLTLFKVQLVQLDNAVSPFIHMKRKFASLQSSYKIRQNYLKSQQQQLKQQLREIQAIEKQIIDSTEIQINVMKTNFIKVINQCKQEIRKYMGKMITINPLNGTAIGPVGMDKIPEDPAQLLQYQKEKSLLYADPEKMKNRKISKVNRAAYQNLQTKKMEIQDYSSQQMAENMYFKQKQENFEKKEKMEIEQLSNKIPFSEPTFKSKRIRIRKKYSSEEGSQNEDSSMFGSKQNKKSFLQLQKQLLLKEQEEKKSTLPARNNETSKDEQQDGWDQLFSK